MKPERILNEIPIPAEVKQASVSQEMIRAWISDNRLVCNLTLGVLGDEEAVTWGLLLSDIARHIADALEQSEGLEPEETLSRLRQIFNRELDSPGAEAQGKLV